MVVCSAGCLCSFEPCKPFHLVAARELQVGHAAAKVLQGRAGRRCWCTCFGRLSWQGLSWRTCCDACCAGLHDITPCIMLCSAARVAEPAKVYGTYLGCQALAAWRVAGQPEGVSRLGCRAARVEEQQVAGTAWDESGGGGWQVQGCTEARSLGWLASGRVKFLPVPLFLPPPPCLTL